jgi:ABC-type uncharacterized transport system substrate-binding protein
MKRREFITLLGGAAVGGPIAARAQQPKMPVVGFIFGGSADANARHAVAFRKGLNEAGYVDGQNVTVEYHWLEGHNDRVPVLVADLVHRQVAVIATPASTPAALAAKAAPATIPIAFGVGDDPVRLGLVTSLARPGGNATGINFLSGELAAKRLELMRELVPAVSRIAVLVNPTDASATQSTMREVETAARAMDVQIQVFNASTSREIDSVFETIARERPDALFLGGDPFFTSRRVQLATMTARHAIPMSSQVREITEAGGLMSYRANLADAFRQAGIYVGSILKGAKPADLPVVQSSAFELVINAETARVLGLTVPPSLLARADEVIE